jgi:hypothetical protein
MRFRNLAVTLLCLAAVVPAAADTFVRFPDGRYLQVQSYTFHPKALELKLDEGMKIVLPLGVADLIESDGQEIALLAPSPKRGGPFTPELKSRTFTTGYLTTGVPTAHGLDSDRASIRPAEEVPVQSPN